MAIGHIATGLVIALGIWLADREVKTVCEQTACGLALN
jgi:hypothetical protein